HIGLVATGIEPVRAQPNLEERHPTLDLRRWAEVGQHLEAGSCGRLDQQLARLLNPFARFARHTQDERATLCLCTGGAVRLGRLPRLRHRSTCLPPNPANPEPRWNPPPGQEWVQGVSSLAAVEPAVPCIATPPPFRATFQRRDRPGPPAGGGARDPGSLVPAPGPKRRSRRRCQVRPLALLPASGVARRRGRWPIVCRWRGRARRAPAGAPAGPRCARRRDAPPLPARAAVAAGAGSLARRR